MDKDRSIISRLYAREIRRRILLQGRVMSLFSLVILPFFYFKDQAISNFAFETLWLRLLPFIGSVLFLLGTSLRSTLSTNLLRAGYGGLASGYVWMIVGFMFFDQSLNGGQHLSQLLNASLVIVLSIYFFSYGIRTYFFAIVGIPYVGMFVALGLSGDLTLAWTANHFNLAALILVFTIMSGMESKRELYAFRGQYLVRLDKKRLEHKIIEQERLRHRAELESLRDAMTGVLNRKALGQLLHKEVQACQQEATSCVIAYFDINNLKYVNDNFGHDQGDALIKRFCEVIDAGTRQTDHLFRIGGDEFVLFLKAMTEPSFASFIAKLRTLADEQQISFSVGHITVDQHSQLSLDEMLRVADQAMYRDKQASRSSRKVVNF